MQLPRLDTDALRLLRKVGRGRCSGIGNGATLALDYRRMQGNGMVITATLGPADVRLWVEGDAWCRWVEPLIALGGTSSVPPELNAALAAWTCASLSGTDGDAADTLHGDAQWPIGIGLANETLPPTYGWCLSATREAGRLDALVLEAPLGWLDAIADRLAPVESQTAPVPHVRASLVAGWSRVPQSAIEALEVGDALMLRTAFRVTDHLFGLFLTRPLARVRCESTDHIEIDYIMDTFDDWLDIEPDIARDAADIRAPEPRVSVVAEVGTLDVPLSALAALSVGDVIAGEAAASELVALKIAGRVIARATLLDIDGKLAARIEQI